MIDFYIAIIATIQTPSKSCNNSNLKQKVQWGITFRCCHVL